MLKKLANKYYIIVCTVAVYFSLNLLFRETLINWIFDTSPDQPVTDANAFANETLLRNVFSLSLLLLFIFTEILSIIFLFSKEGKHLNKIVLIIVALLIGYSLFLILISGGFSSMISRLRLMYF
jgi:uncharacterized membrane-anchored protein